MARGHCLPDIPIKCYHADLKRLGIVKSRYDQHEKIRQGKLRRPHKNGSTMQSAAWWWGSDIADDLERERFELEVPE